MIEKNKNKEMNACKEIIRPEDVWVTYILPFFKEKNNWKIKQSESGDESKSGNIGSLQSFQTQMIDYSTVLGVK